MSAKKAARKASAKKTASEKAAAKDVDAKKAKPKNATAGRAAVRKAAKKAATAEAKEADNVIQMPGKAARAVDALGAMAKEHLTPLVKQHGKKVVAKALLELAKRSKNPLAKKGLGFLGDMLS